MALIRLLGGIGSQQSTTEQPCYSPGRLLILHGNVSSWRCCGEEWSAAAAAAGVFAFLQGGIRRSRVTCQCGDNHDWNSIRDTKETEGIPVAVPARWQDCSC